MSAARDVGGTKKVKKVATGSRGDSGTAVDKPRKTPVAPPKGDVASSGGDYGTKRAAPQVKRELKRIKTRQAEVKDTKSNADRGRAKQAPKLTKLSNGQYVDLSKVSKVQKVDTPEERARKQAAAIAPVTKVLEQTTRPLHATAGGIKAGIEGKNVPKAALRGLENKDKYGFGEVLAAAGVKNKAVRGIGGFVGDLVGDPLVYTTGGVGSIARKAAEDEAARVAAKAAKAGVGKEAAKTAAREAKRKGASDAAAEQAGKAAQRDQIGRLAHRAGQNAAEKAQPGSGIYVKFAGKEIAGVRKATAKVGRGAGKVLPKKGRTTARRIGNEFRPGIRPRKGMNQEAFRGARAAQSEQRAITHSYERKAERESMHLRKALTPDEQHAVDAAIEKGPRYVRKLKDPEFKKTVQDEMANLRGQARARRQAGRAQGNIGRKRLSEAQRKLKRIEGKGGSSREILDLIKQIQDEAAAAEATHAAKGYFPHMKQEDIAAGKAGLHEREVKKNGNSKLKPTSSMKRGDPRSIREQNPERKAAGKSPYSTNAPLVHQNYTLQTGRVVGGLHAVTELAKTGREVKGKPVIKQVEKVDENGVKYKQNVVKGVKWSDHTLGEGEGLYELANRGGRYTLREVSKPMKKTFGKVPKKYYVLDRDLVHHTLDASARGPMLAAGENPLSHTIHVYDKGTRGFKKLATGTLGFHVRNLIGDTHMHYLAAGGRNMPKNYKEAGRIVRLTSRSETHHTLGRPFYEQASNRTVDLGKSGEKSSHEYAKELERNGITRGGQRAIDVKSTPEELAGAQGVTHPSAPGFSKVPILKHTPLRNMHPGVRANRWMQNREDLARVATYTHFRRQGFSEKEAARLTHEGPHPDYADLSFTEREIMRRFAPFYTFSARSLPFHAKTLVKNPGRIAALQKVVENSQKTFGADYTGFNANQQRNIPILIKTGKNTYGVHWSDPMNILNELPTTVNPIEYGKELESWGMGLSTPILKDPVEYFNNYSFFFRSQIEPDPPGSPVVPAPRFVDRIPAGLRKQLRIEQDSKGRWWWPGKLDYLAKSLPGMPNLIEQSLTPGANRSGMSSTAKVLSGLTGIKVMKSDPTGVAISHLYDVGNEIAKRQSVLRRLHKSDTDKNWQEVGKNAKEWQDLKAQAKAIGQQINALSIKRGDAKPLKPQAKPKPPAAADGSSSGGDDLFSPSQGADGGLF